jgi:hypothetical protein
MKFAKYLILVLIKEHSLIPSKPKITVKAWILSDIPMLLEFVLLHLNNRLLVVLYIKKGSMLKFSGEWQYGDTHAWVCLLLYGTVKLISGQHREWVKSVSSFLYSFTELLLENYWVVPALWFFNFSHPVVELEILNAEIIKWYMFSIDKWLS